MHFLSGVDSLRKIPWSRPDIIALIGLVVAVVGAIAAVLAIPALQPILGVTDDQSSSSTTCPSLPSSSDIAGTWWSEGNNATMMINRTGCKFSASFGETPAPHHELIGEYKDSKTNYVIRRTANNCTVIFYGYFSNISRDQMTSNVYATSGACGFPEGWQESLTWVRRN